MALSCIGVYRTEETMQGRGGGGGGGKIDIFKLYLGFIYA